MKNFLVRLIVWYEEKRFALKREVAELHCLIAHERGAHNFGPDIPRMTGCPACDADRKAKVAAGF